MTCPDCGQYNDPALSPSGRIPPKDFDPIICVGCRTVLCIDHAAPGGLRHPDDNDRAAWQSDRRLARTLNAHSQTLKENPDP